MGSCALSPSLPASAPREGPSLGIIYCLPCGYGGGLIPPHPKGEQPVGAASSNPPCIYRLLEWKSPLSSIRCSVSPSPIGGVPAAKAPQPCGGCAPWAPTATLCQCLSLSPAAHPELVTWIRMKDLHREDGPRGGVRVCQGGGQPRVPTHPQGSVIQAATAQPACFPASSTISAVHIYFLKLSKEAVFLFRAAEFAHGAGWTSCPVAPSVQATG